AQGEGRSAFGRNLCPNCHPEPEWIAFRRIGKRLCFVCVNSPRDRRACKRIDEIIGSGALGRHSFNCSGWQPRLDQQLAAQRQPWLIGAALDLLGLAPCDVSSEPPERRFGWTLG